MRRIHIILAALLVFAATTAHATRSYNALTTEYCDYYSGADTLDNAAQMPNFRTWMAQSVNNTNVFDINWPHSHDFANGNVWDTDFYDPDYSGAPSGSDDTDNFDDSGSAMSLYAGHGNCQDDPLLVPSYKQQFCNTAADCTNPAGYGPYVTMPSRCVLTPSAASAGKWGICEYNLTTGRSFIISDGTTDKAIYYTNPAIRFGEDPGTLFSPNYGANGGMNVFALYTSCSVRPGQWASQLGTMFNGLEIMIALMPTVPEQSGEWNDVTGTNFLSKVVTEHYNTPGGTVHTSWENAFHNTGAGDACAYGGGYGSISGCGAAVTIGEDFNSVYASVRAQTLTWANAMGNSAKPSYNWSAAAVWSCNYNCSTYPISK